MSTKNHIQTITCYTRLRSTRQKGISAVIIRLTIDGAPDRIPLGINWPTSRFDTISGKLLPRFVNDTECLEQNLIIEKYMSVANKLRLQYYAHDKPVTLKEFKQSFINFSSRESFLDYMEYKISDLYNKGLCSLRSKKNYTAVLNKLKDYPASKTWFFNTITAADIKMYENWLKKFGKIEKNKQGKNINVGLAYNSVVGHIKAISKFFTEAIKEKIPLENPFEHIKIPGYVPGHREIIDKAELTTLLNFRTSNLLTEHEKNCLDRYLVACFTGLRKGDIEALDPRKHIVNGRLLLSPSKTEDFGTFVNFQIPKQALDILNDYEKSGFTFIHDSSLNKTLKVAVAKAGIKKYLKFHSSRDCFAVLYLKFGGNLGDLKDILGHKKISTTEIYLKMGSDAKNDIMSLFEAI